MEEGYKVDKGDQVDRVDKIICAYPVYSIYLIYQVYPYKEKNLCTLLVRIFISSLKK